MACTQPGTCTGLCAANGCISTCRGNCSGGCTGSCTGYCGGCGYACSSNCSGCSGCGSGCASSCQGCKGSCSGSCSGGCSGSCRTSCSGCSGSCSGSCTGTCQGDCNDACTASGRLEAIESLATSIDLTIGGKITITGLNQLKDYASQEVKRRGKTPGGALAGSLGSSVTAADANNIFTDIKALGKEYHAEIGDIVVTDSFDESIAYLQSLMKQNIKG